MGWIPILAPTSRNTLGFICSASSMTAAEEEVSPLYWLSDTGAQLFHLTDL